MRPPPLSLLSPRGARSWFGERRHRFGGDISPGEVGTGTAEGESLRPEPAAILLHTPPKKKLKKSTPKTPPGGGVGLGGGCFSAGCAVAGYS